MAKSLEIAKGLKVVKLSNGKLKRNTFIKVGVMLEGFYEDYPGIYYYTFG